MRYQLSALEDVWGALLIAVVVGVIYYVSSRGTHRLRLGVAAHSGALLVSFAYALAVSPWSGDGSWKILIWPFWLLLATFVVGLVFAILRFRGHLAVHAAQLLQLPAALYIWFIGTMTITHDWI